MIFLVHSCSAQNATPAQSSRVVAGYFEEWGIDQTHYNVANLEKNGVAASLTHLLYAFGSVVTEPQIGCSVIDPKAAYLKTGVPSVSGAEYTSLPFGNFGALIQLKKLHPDLRVLISIGGQLAGNAAFAKAARTDAGRKALTSSCIDVFIKGRVGNDTEGKPVSIGDLFDGFNLDWEYPAAADKHNFTLLVKEFRRQLNQLGERGARHYWLTIDSPTQEKNYANVEMAAIAEQLDFLTLDGYDFANSADPITNHASALFDLRAKPGAETNPSASAGLSWDAAVTAYLKAGVPGRKLVMGIPLFGVGWKGVEDVNHGLYQPAKGAAPSPEGDIMAAPGVASFATLSTLTAGGFTRYFDPQRMAVWLYDPATKIFWSYDDSFTVMLKMLYVEERVPGGLGGVFVWALKDDDANGSQVKLMHEMSQPGVAEGVRRTMVSSHVNRVLK